MVTLPFPWAPWSKEDKLFNEDIFSGIQSKPDTYLPPPAF